MPKKSGKNLTPDENKILVMEAYEAILKKGLFKKNKVSIKALIEHTGLTRRQVGLALEKISIDDYAPKYRLMAPDVIEALIRSAKSGSTKAIKLYFQLMYSWVEPKDTEILDPDSLKPIINIATTYNPEDDNTMLNGSEFN
jgi:hypothetical protein